MKISILIDGKNRNLNGLARIVIEVQDLETSYALHLPFDGLFARFATPDSLSVDLLITASICYVVDKVVPRSTAYDFWTRDLELQIPVANLKLWKAANREFTRTLNFLTGDHWKLSFSSSDTPVFETPQRKKGRRKSPNKLEFVDAVCSLSGGVDSLVGAINLLENSDLRGIHLIGHYDAPGTKKPQGELFAAISQKYPNKAELLQVRVSHTPVGSNESTLRSRSLVFFAIGLYAARAAGVKVPLYMPENGFIAMNVPLTPSRVGSCSTRTMHPFFLTQLNSALNKLGIDNPIIYPFEFKTKGECIVECSNLDFFCSIADQTVSCSHGSRKQIWKRRSADIRNCGYCVPCLVRRAALNKAGIDNPATYGIDVCAGELDYREKKSSSDDLRAIINLIRDNRTAAEIEKYILAVAPVSQPRKRALMIERGLSEIRSLFQDKSSKKVLQNVGISLT